MVSLGATATSCLAYILVTFAIIVIDQRLDNGVIIIFLLVPLAVLVFVMGYVQLIAIIKRAHDVNRSRHLAWLFLLPVLNLLLLLYLIVKRGTSGPNNYGDAPG